MSLANSECDVDNDRAVSPETMSRVVSVFIDVAHEPELLQDRAEAAVHRRGNMGN